MSSATSLTDTTGAKAYEEYLVRPVFGPWAEFIVALAAPLPTEHALDLACGTGAATRALAPRTAKTTAVDKDPAMLLVARNHCPASVEYQCSDASELALPDGAFDLCLCLQALQHFTQRERALGEIRRVLKPHGRFVAAVWAGIEHNPGLYAVLHALQEEGIDAAAFNRPFSLGAPDALASLVRQAGFDPVRTNVYERSSHFESVDAFLVALSVGSVASRDALRGVRQDGWPAFRSRVREELAPFTSSTGLAVPYRANVVIATD
jgi:SAM-dependent methyltransferase